MKLQMKTKKIERAYTEVTDLRHLMRAFAARGDKIMFDYYDSREEVQRISYAAFVERVEAFTAGLAALSLRGVPPAVWLLHAILPRMLLTVLFSPILYGYVRLIAGAGVRRTPGAS